MHSSPGACHVFMLLRVLFHLMVKQWKPLDFGLGPPSHDVLTPWAPWAHLNFYCCSNKIIKQLCVFFLEHVSGKKALIAHIVFITLYLDPSFHLLWGVCLFKIFISSYFSVLCSDWEGKNPSWCPSSENVGCVKGHEIEKLRVVTPVPLNSSLGCTAWVSSVVHPVIFL